MGINLILQQYSVTLSKSTQLLSQRQTVTDKVYVVTNTGNAIGIGLSPQLIAQRDPKHNEL